MSLEQKVIVRRLVVLISVFALIILSAYLVYRPSKEPVATIRPNGQDGQKTSILAWVRSGRWFIDSNANGHWDGQSGGDTEVVFGNPGDTPLAGVWAKSLGPSIGVFNNGNFSILVGGTTKSFHFGEPGDKPVVGDWTGQGYSNVGVFRKGFWLLDLNGNGHWDGSAGDRLIGVGGTPGEIPVVGDWNGDGRSKVGVYREDGIFQLDFNGNGVWDKDDKMLSFGQKGDTPVVGDWTGDGRTKIGVFRKGFWLLDLNGNGHWDGNAGDRLIGLGGTAGEIPVVGDWNGDGRSKVGVFKQTGAFELDFNGNGVWDKDDKTYNLGSAGDIPVILNPIPGKK